MAEDIIYTGEKPKKEIFEVFSETLKSLFEEDSGVVYLDADLMASMRTGDLWRKYPDHVFNTGIAEANMVGVACGMYLAGMKPYIHSFAPFVTRRVFDQVYLSVGYAKKSVTIIGSEPGICAADNGGTHMTFEDIALMRTIPGACVVDVSDAKVFESAMRFSKDRMGVTYIRTPRRGLPDIYSGETTFEQGKGKVIRDGTDVTIVASGIMTSTAIEAGRILEKKGVSAAVIDPVTIKPLDTALIEKYARKTGCIVTAENHNIIGGLGSAVLEALAEQCPVRTGMSGIRDSFGEVGDDAYLRKRFKLNDTDIVDKVMELIK